MENGELLFLIVVAVVFIGFMGALAFVSNMEEKSR
jgi:hypothetical protein